MTQEVAIYARVSTQQQVEEATIESQVAALESYAQEQGYTCDLAHIFLDEGISGSQLDRPALNRMRDIAAEGIFSAVLCLSPDRLSRQYAHQWVLIDEFKRAGVAVIFINQPKNKDDPQGQLLLGIQGLFSEYERSMITERLRRGKLHRMRQGQLASPNPPYGYRYIPVSEPDGGRWVVSETEADVIRQIYRWYTSEEQPSVTAIANRLNDQGVSPQRGPLWRYKSVYAILTQTAYVGRVHFNTTRTDHSVVGRPKKHGRGIRLRPGHQPRSRDEWVELQVSAILDTDLWEQAQEQLKVKQKFAPRNNKRHFYLLRSLLVCDVCGRTLVGQTWNGGYTVYRCSNGGRRREPCTPAHRRVVHAEIIEPLVWNAVTNLLDNPALMADAWQAEAQANPGDAGELTRLRNRQRSLQKQWARLLDAFADGLLDKPDLHQRKQQINQAGTSIAQRIHKLEQNAHHAEVKEQMLADFETFCTEIKTKINQATPKLQQEIIRLLMDHIVVKEDEIIIKHILPTDNDSRLLYRRR